MKPRIDKKTPAPTPAAGRRRPLVLGISIALGLAAAATAFFSMRSANQPLQRGAGFNVVLISMDTTRADHLGCYGCKTIRTPHIDQLAAEGILFEQCATAVPLTLPSHSTMLTGTYPFVHGARDNGQFHLHPDNLTLPEVLKANGYATGAEIGAFVLNHEFGFDQGFDDYHDIQKVEGEATHTTLETQRVAEDVANGALAWLRKNAQKPFFLFVHFFDPHQPYLPPKKFAAAYPNDLYKGEIAYTDEQIGRILAELKTLGLDRKTLVILTADHGQGCFEHGEETHGHQIYDSTMHVPLILRCPAKLPAGLRMAGQARTADIAPTALDFLGLGPQTLPQAQGVSLLSFVEQGARDTGLAAYGETLGPLFDYGYSPLRMLRTGEWKYIHAPQPELYDVAHDPGEKINLATQQPRRVAEMREQLRNLVKNAPSIGSAGGGQHAPDEKSLAAIRSLGYVGGAPAALANKTELDLFEPAGPDPKDHIEDINLTGRAMGLSVGGQHAEAEKALKQLLARGGANQAHLTLAHTHLANSLGALGKYDEAAEHYRIALENQPNDSLLLANLGAALLQSGKTNEAIQSFRQALEAKPVYARAPYGLGMALAATGQLEEAVEQLRKAIEMDPNMADAYLQLAQLYARAGPLPEAVEAYNHALRLRPAQSDWRRALAETLLRQNRPQDALQQLEVVLKANAKDAPAFMLAAQAHQLANQPDEAITKLRQALQLNPRVPAWWDIEATFLLERQRYKETIAALRKGMEFNPGHAGLMARLAWLLATIPDDPSRNGAEAVRLAEAARKIVGRDNPLLLDALAAALAETGRFEEAARTAEEAVRLAEAAAQTELAEQIKARRALYEAQKPYRTP